MFSARGVTSDGGRAPNRIFTAQVRSFARSAHGGRTFHDHCVGRVISYRTPFFSTVRVTVKIRYWQKGIILPLLRAVAGTKVIPVWPATGYPMQGIESLPIPCNTRLGRSPEPIHATPFPKIAQAARTKTCNHCRYQLLFRPIISRSLSRAATLSRIVRSFSRAGREAFPEQQCNSHRWPWFRQLAKGRLSQGRLFGGFEEGSCIV